MLPEERSEGFPGETRDKDEAIVTNPEARRRRIAVFGPRDQTENGESLQVVRKQGRAHTR